MIRWNDLLILVFTVLLPLSVYATPVRDFNDWSDWVYYTPTDCDPYCGPIATNTDPTSYPGVSGWRNITDGNRDMGDWRPRSFVTSGYGQHNSAEIVSDNIAPSTSSGGALRVWDNGESTTYQSSFWVFFELGDNVLSSISGTTGNNRMSFYVKIDEPDGMPNMGQAGGIPTMMHVGTYACWDGYCNSGEGPGQQHYYHYLSLNSGGWFHVKLDTHPNIRRGPMYIGDTDYVFNNFGQYYFDRIIRLYTEIRWPKTDATQMWLDEYEIYTEPHSENDESICSLLIGYLSGIDQWEISWHDLSFYNDTYTQGLNDITESTFEIRWSTLPITNENYTSANIVTPLYYAENATGSTQLVGRIESWSTTVWTRFELPDEVETANSRVYFAVKDVSAVGEHIGTAYPWNRYGDYHNAPSPLIKTIDYYLSPYTQTAPTVNAGSDQSVSVDTATISGTATASTGRTITNVTCPGETVTPDDGAWGEQTEGWTCVLTDLAEGQTTKTFTGTDSEAETGTDSVAITYTPTSSCSVNITSSPTSSQAGYALTANLTAGTGTVSGVTVNGVSATCADGTCDEAVEELSYPVSLVVGNNPFNVAIADDGAGCSDSISVNYSQSTNRITISNVNIQGVIFHE